MSKILSLALPFKEGQQAVSDIYAAAGRQNETISSLEETLQHLKHLLYEDSAALYDIAASLDPNKHIGSISDAYGIVHEKVKIYFLDPVSHLLTKQERKNLEDEPQIDSMYQDFRRPGTPPDGTGSLIPIALDC